MLCTRHLLFNESPFNKSLKITLRIFSNDTSSLSDLAEKNRYHCCRSFNSHRRVRACDTDFQPNSIRSYHDLSDTPKATICTKSMDLSETHHSATCRTLNTAANFFSFTIAYFVKLTLWPFSFNSQWFENLNNEHMLFYLKIVTYKFEIKLNNWTNNWWLFTCN